MLQGLEVNLGLGVLRVLLVLLEIFLFVVHFLLAFLDVGVILCVQLTVHMEGLRAELSLLYCKRNNRCC